MSNGHLVVCMSRSGLPLEVHTLTWALDRCTRYEKPYSGYWGFVILWTILFWFIVFQLLYLKIVNISHPSNSCYCHFFKYWTKAIERRQNLYMKFTITRFLRYEAVCLLPTVVKTFLQISVSLEYISKEGVGGGVCVSKCIKAVLFDNFPNIPIFCVKIPKSDPAPLKYHIVCNCFHRCVIHIFKFCSSKYASFLEGVPV